jgi:hypothetical protein
MEPDETARAWAGGIHSGRLPDSAVRGDSMFLKVLFPALAAAALAMAQGRGGDMGPSGGGRDQRGGSDSGTGSTVMRPQKETKADQMANRLKLSKDQKAEFLTILASTAKEAAPMIQDVMHSRNMLANALISGKGDAEIAAAVKAMNDAQFQMTGVEVMAFKRIVALLKPNQAARAPEAFDLMGDIFLPRGGGGGGGAGGLGRRGER